MSTSLLVVFIDNSCSLLSCAFGCLCIWDPIIFIVCISCSTHSFSLCGMSCWSMNLVHLAYYMVRSHWLIVLSDFSVSRRMLDHFHLEHLILHAFSLVLILFYLLQLCFDTCLVSNMCVSIKFSCSFMNEVLCSITMPTYSTQELSELSSMSSAYFDVKKQVLLWVTCSEVCSSSYAAVTDDEPLSWLKNFGTFGDFVIFW